MPKNLTLLFDVLFYFILPIFCWEVLRVYLSDYLAILISSFPGIGYSIYRYLQTKALSFTRLFLLINIISGLLIDLLSRTALQVLWNDAFYSLGLSVLYLGSCFLFKPLLFYFTLDILVLRGYDRKLTKEILLTKEALRIFRITTLMNSIREVIYASFLLMLIPKYGVEMYTYSIIFDQLFSFLMSGVSLIAFIFLHRLIHEIVTVNKYSSRKRFSKARGLDYYFYFEGSYFFLRKHF